MADIKEKKNTMRTSIISLSFQVSFALSDGGLFRREPGTGRPDAQTEHSA